MVGNKFNAQKTEAFGRTFASKKEARRYGDLKTLERAGEISGLICQPRFDLTVNGIRVGRWTPDFSYFEADQEIVEDVKGGNATKTEAYRLRVKLFKALYPQFEVRET